MYPLSIPSLPIFLPISPIITPGFNWKVLLRHDQRLSALHSLPFVSKAGRGNTGERDRIGGSCIWNEKTHLTSRSCTTNVLTPCFLPLTINCAKTAQCVAVDAAPVARRSIIREGSAGWPRFDCLHGGGKRRLTPDPPLGSPQMRRVDDKLVRPFI